jgi:hypothetical protein
MLREYLDGQPIESMTVQGLQDLGQLFNGLKEGQYTWPDVMRLKNEPAEGDPTKPLQPSKRNRLRDTILEKPEAPKTEETK